MSAELRKRIINGWMWSIGSRILGTAATLILYSLLARSLPPSELGGYFLIISIVAFFSTLTLFGMPQVAVRVIATSSSESNGGNVRDAISKTLIFVLTSNLLVILLLNTNVGVGVVESVLHSEGKVLFDVRLIGLLVFFTSMTILVAEYFRGFHDTRLASIFGGTLTSVVVVAFFYILWAVGITSLENAILATLSASMVALAIAIIVFLFFWKKIPVGDKISYKYLTRSALPIFILNLSVFFSNQGEIWVVNNKLSTDDVATYGAVLKVVALLVMTHVLLIAASQSSMAELYGKKNISLLQTLARTVSTISSVVGMMALLVFFVWGGGILSIIFGSFYSDGYQLMMIMATFYVLGVSFGPSGILLMMAGKMEVFIWAIIVSVLIRAIAAYALVSDFGMIGVAIGWGIGGLFQSICGWYLVKKQLGLFSHADFFRKNILKIVYSYSTSKLNSRN